jgi:sorting nexin-14
VLALKPWLNLEVPQSVDAALEEFLNQVLQEFVYSWYRDVSQDEAFMDEIRTSLRFIASVLLRRLQKVDLPTFITQKVLNTAMRHLHLCLLAVQQQNAMRQSGRNVEQVVLDFYGTSLHCALHNRRSELDYMRQLAENVFPLVLPPQSVECRCLCSLLREILAGAILLPAMDVLADPDKVNVLLLLFFDNSRTDYSQLPSSPLVPLLGNFSRPLRQTNTSLKLQLSDVLSDQEILFSFMKFMKAEASVNVLQFYLSIEEFNAKLLTPELNRQQLMDLHKQLCDLYRMYIDPKSLDCVRLEDDIIIQLKAICDGSPEDVVKLQTTTPLFRAHEHAYVLLEHTFLPLFVQSDVYYTMMCGERLPIKIQRSLSKMTGKRSGDMLTLSRISNKIKGVFKTGTVEGRLLSDDMDYDAIETESELAMEIDALDVLSAEHCDDESHLRDLSAWRVTIPKIKTKPEPDNPRKHVFVFCIQVHRLDVVESAFERLHWMLERRYHEFYVLDQKLQEFHGEFEDAQLPSKKTFLPKSISFYDSQREIFESYLQKLLTKPVLRGSELLYSFLTSDQEFTTSFLDVNLGKKMKSGALRLLKERGQHLDPFLKSFLISTETLKAKPGRSGSDKDSDTISISSEMMSNSIYSNNANVERDVTPVTPGRPARCPPDGAVEQLTSIYDSIVYLALHIFSAPRWFVHMLVVVRMLIRNTFDTYLDWYLGDTLETLLIEHRIVHIIHLLRDALFTNRDPPRTDDDKRCRRDKAFQELQDFIPKPFVQLIGDDKHQEGTKMLFDLLQQPRLNKQLSYMLLDQAIMEVFPELIVDDSSSSMATTSC